MKHLNSAEEKEGNQPFNTSTVLFGMVYGLLGRRKGFFSIFQESFVPGIPVRKAAGGGIRDIFRGVLIKIAIVERRYIES